MAHENLIKACEGRVRLGPGEYPVSDYPWSIKEVADIDSLLEAFQFGNWSVRTGFVLGDLAFVEQISSENEWLALKRDKGEWKTFDSISFYSMLKKHGTNYCREYIKHLQKTSWYDLKHPKTHEDASRKPTSNRQKIGKPLLYIAYGSNLNLTQMAHRCPTAKVVGASELKDYELTFRGGKRGAVATVEPKEGISVPILIWKLKPRDEQALDRYEGYPSFYRKEFHDVELDGKLFSTMVYVMNEGRALGAPSDYYYNTIREGYESAGFDVAFLDAAVDNSIQLAEQQRQQELEEMEALAEQEMDDLDQCYLSGMKWW